MIQNQDRTEEKPISELMDPRQLKAAPQSADTQRQRAEEALRQSEERYRTIIDNIEDAYWELDLSGKVTFFNDCVVRLHGRSREELMGLSYKEYLDEESAKQVSQKFHQVYSTGEPATAVFWEIIRGDGARRTLESTVSLIRDSEGKPIGFRGISRDITERKRTEEAVRQSEERYRTIIEDMTDSYVETDLAGKFTFFNNQAAIGQRRSKEQLMGLSNKQYMDEETVKRVGKAYKQVYLTGEPLKGLTFEMTRGDGTSYYVESNVSLIRDSQGKPVGFRTTSRDVTERKLAEEELAKQRSFLRQVIDLNPSFVFAKDREGRFTLVNQAIAEAYGVSVEDLLGKTDADFNSNEDEVEQFRRDDLEVMDTLQEKVIPEEAITDAGGQLRWLQTIKRPIVSGNGTANQILGISTDITARKQAEEALSRSEDQLRQAQKMEAVGQLAGGVAHDFNNLLTAINGYSEICLRSLTPEDPLYRKIEEIKKAGDRAASLTRQLLAFSRKQILQPKIIDLNRVVADLNKMLPRLIGEDIDLVIGLAPDLGNVKADPNQIEQVLLNLSINARDAMPKGGKLTIETSNVNIGEEYAGQHTSVRPGDYVMLAVSDTGSGMDAQTQAHIFEPFFTTKGVGKGTGLGLATVYGIVKQSEGNIWVYSEVGVGTSFKIYLPCVESSDKRVQARTDNPKSSKGAETVLLVEDEELVRNLATEVLRESGYQVLEAKHGNEALIMGKQHDGVIHLMLTDIVMPQMGGRELVEHLAPLRRDMKVLYMSGYTDDAIVHHGVLEEGTAFIGKPFTPDTLARKVREILDAPGAA